jgi:UDP-N-acetylmuramoylalanine--D-glutamate ligase
VSPGRTLIFGLGVTGWSTASALAARGVDVVVADDRADETHRARAAELGASFADVPDDIDEFVTGFDTVVPAPGVPESHPVIARALAVGRPVVGELELAYRYEQTRENGPRPMLAVTGTDGKTTTTLLTAAMLRAGGRRPIAAGNTETPLIEAIADESADVFVVECTSFRLAWTEQFRADAAVWLNLAPDHLNWHSSMDTYEAAKARLFSQQRRDDVAIGNLADPTVMRHLRSAPGRRLTFGLDAGDYHSDGTSLVGPSGAICALEAMGRSLPHDITNALAAAALVLETGLVTASAVTHGVAHFDAPPHRLQFVGEADGVRWYDDSKATTPHAASVALAAFDGVVLIAGGLNKGLELWPMAEQSERVRSVVAIGRDAGDIEEAFAGRAPVERADSMAAAVALAAARAQPGDTVLLSPGCASFDWYPDGGYEARGDDFQHHVRSHLVETTAAAPGGDE